ncbi:hypothetical protein D1AOALGA4SA_10828 [Olavius algarvensis Delta 1 endosymbiont]|nr:hypothetical protein D1AOALGA4SA_10828 [Olavius algarvensis Delta 1 endosymbiont]
MRSPLARENGLIMNALLHGSRKFLQQEIRGAIPGYGGGITVTVVFE